MAFRERRESLEQRRRHRTTEAPETRSDPLSGGIHAGGLSRTGAVKEQSGPDFLDPRRSSEFPVRKLCGGLE